MSNVENVEVGMSDNAGQRGPAKCELLCFVREKCSIMATDHLVKICADFYRGHESRDRILVLHNSAQTCPLALATTLRP